MEMEAVSVSMLRRRNKRDAFPRENLLPSQSTSTSLPVSRLITSILAEIITFTPRHHHTHHYTQHHYTQHHHTHPSPLHYYTVHSLSMPSSDSFWKRGGPSPTAPTWEPRKTPCSGPWRRTLNPTAREFSWYVPLVCLTLRHLPDIATVIFTPPLVAAHPRAPGLILPARPPPPPPWPPPSRPSPCLRRRRRHQSDRPHLQLGKYINSLTISPEFG
jgi:hypothetical protein